MTTLIIPERGAPVTAEMLGAIEQKAAIEIASVESIEQLETWRRQAAALEHYLRDKELQRPMLGVQRRVEARIGQLLGNAKPGPAQSSVVTEVSDKDARSVFRILAHALDGRCALEPDEWRKSRRALVSLVRNKVGLVPEMAPRSACMFRGIVADPPFHGRERQLQLC